MYGLHIFEDRAQAGRHLAGKLAPYAWRGDVVVLALPRGGVPVGYEVARALGAPLDVLVVRRLRVPGYGELTMGALAEGGFRVLDEELVRRLQVPPKVVDRVSGRARAEVERRRRTWRGERPAPELRGKTVILVDDGTVTGFTLRAAIGAAWGMGAARVVAAAPVAPPSTCRMLRALADEVVCVETPEPFPSIGFWYRTFPPISDQEVREILEAAWYHEGPTGPAELTFSVDHAGSA
jgi:predicted phosphoribosyltransferase